MTLEEIEAQILADCEAAVAAGYRLVRGTFDGQYLTKDKVCCPLAAGKAASGRISERLNLRRCLDR